MIPTTTRWLHDADAQRVCRVVQDGGHRIYFVGGCVRDALLGLPDSDVDLSTDATPETVMALAKAAGVKAVPTGIEHGTVTLVSGGKPFEITTFGAMWKPMAAGRLWLSRPISPRTPGAAISR